MSPDRVSNPRPLTYESGALPIALRGPATRIFIELDSACRNQQGNCTEVENSARPCLLFFQHCG